MAKQTVKNYNVSEMAPDEVGALKSLVKDFMDRVSNIDNELECLKDDRKSVIEEFSQKLDVKTLQMALKVLKIQKGVQHRDTFDLFVDVLTDPAQ